jgi:hypothetical protein
LCSPALALFWISQKLSFSLSYDIISSPYALSKEYGIGRLNVLPLPPCIHRPSFVKLHIPKAIKLDWYHIDPFDVGFSFLGLTDIDYECNHGLANDLYYSIVMLK